VKERTKAIFCYSPFSRPDWCDISRRRGFYDLKSVVVSRSLDMALVPLCQLDRNSVRRKWNDCPYFCIIRFPIVQEMVSTTIWCLMLYLFGRSKTSSAYKVRYNDMVLIAWLRHPLVVHRGTSRDRHRPVGSWTHSPHKDPMRSGGQMALT
jgi:hypothetical protein